MLIYYKYAFPLEHMGPCCADLSTKPFLHLPLQLLTVTPQGAVTHSQPTPGHIWTPPAQDCGQQWAAHREALLWLSPAVAVPSSGVWQYK